MKFIPVIMYKTLWALWIDFLCIQSGDIFYRLFILRIGLGGFQFNILDRSDGPYSGQQSLLAFGLYCGSWTKRFKPWHGATLLIGAGFSKVRRVELYEK